MVTSKFYGTENVTIVKYSQTRDYYTDSYSEGTVVNIFDPFIVNPNFSGLTESTVYKFTEFDSSNSVTINNNSYNVTSSFNGDEINSESLGQEFTSGISKPDINTKSGDILYVDNRVPVNRSPDQREDIKIIIEF